MLGHEIRCPVDLMFGLPLTVNDFCQIEYVEWVKNTLREAYKHVYDHSGQAAQRQKSYYDRGLKVRKSEPNCWVWRWYPPKVNQTLGLGWNGPYLVIKKITDVTYKIQKTEQTKSIIVHVDHLKPYLGKNEPNNWILNTSLNISHQNDESLNQDMLVSQALTPVVYTPERQLTKTRIGRTVKPRDVYSPISDEIVHLRADEQELQQFRHLVIHPFSIRWVNTVQKITSKVKGYCRHHQQFLDANEMHLTPTPIIVNANKLPSTTPLRCCPICPTPIQVMTANQIPIKLSKRPSSTYSDYIEPPKMPISFFIPM
ncbi:unnamed protein product [Mytilus coruscus]|uniref:Integrase p58-like C-terminal domain-containing protein n=1 Tax=Mytilus coruscus TaxID=42192 RepID=A0A6J8BTR3_MYTCO|nr:unnamed protein product [Mytilus coruscus]